MINVFGLQYWKYIGQLEGVIGECPNVFQLGNKWVIIRSTHPISYVLGQLVLNGDDIRFTEETPARVMDHAYGKNLPPGRPASWSGKSSRFRTRGP